MSRIVFLDVDGPLIPGRMYFRRGATYSSKSDLYTYCPYIVDMLNYLTDAAEAKIVFNSTHNDRGAEMATRQAEHNRLRNLHEDVVTGFPIDEWGGGPDERQRAINKWLAAHPEVLRHCIFDDEELDGDNFRRVDFDDGISTRHIAWALEHLTGQKGNGLGFTPGYSPFTDGLAYYLKRDSSC